MEDDDGDFVHALLAFFDGADADAAPAGHIATPAAPPAPPAPAPSSRAVSSGGAAHTKRVLEALRAEAAALTDQLDRLRRAHGTERVSAAKELALVERRRRRRAEAECVMLREAMYAQRRFTCDLRSVFSSAPRFAMDLDLCRYLHRHTRLARNRRSRWGEFDLESHDERMRSAMDVLCCETEAMKLSTDTTENQTEPSGHTPVIDGEATDSGDCYSTTSMAVYPVDSSDLSAIVRAACVAIRGVATLCVSGHPLQVVRDIVDVDASPANNILYRVLVVHHPSASHCDDELSIETHMLMSYKIMDDHAIVLWDFVDVDELHPTADSTNIAREVTGACLIRREWCADGVERTVLRSLATKKFRFLSQEAASRLRRIACLTQPAALVRDSEMMFRRIVLDQLAAERALYDA